jgi:glycosyltransferase involved in cell wall biosynthesis
MKIAFLIGEIRANAGQTHDIAEIIKYLLSCHPDWEISVLTPRIVLPVVEGMNDKRVHIVKLTQYYSAIFLKHHLVRIFRDYDLLYIKGNYPYIFPAVNSGKKTILVLHQIDSPKLFKGLTQKLKIIASNFMTPFVLRKVDSLVTVTQELKEFYEKRYKVKINVIEDQISDIFFTSVVRTIPRDSEVIKLLTVGYWDGFNGRKRQDILIKSFAEITKSNPKLHLTLVGLNSDNIEQLRNISEELSLKEKIEFKGYLGETELLEEFKRNHIYVTATTYEGFYRQIIEAFATGMPSLVYDSRLVVSDPSQCASSNHVVKSKAGMLYRDSSSMLQGIRTITQNYNLFSLNGINYAENFRSSVVGKKTAEHIYGLLDNV